MFCGRAERLDFRELRLGLKEGLAVAYVARRSMKSDLADAERSSRATGDVISLCVSLGDSSSTLIHHTGTSRVGKCDKVENDDTFFQRTMKSLMIVNNPFFFDKNTFSSNPGWSLSHTAFKEHAGRVFCSENSEFWSHFSFSSRNVFRINFIFVFIVVAKSRQIGIHHE